jgi:ElaB/YqjD/DUF883 family membrane-anchored ribosome-binding protein
MSETEIRRTWRDVGREIENDGSFAADAATKAMSEFGQKASEAAGDAGAAIRDASRKVGAAASDMGNDVYDRSRRMGRDAADRIQAQPVASVIVAAVAGLFAGLLIARR